MDRIVQEFLKSHRVSVLSIVQDDGTVHAAALHFAYTDDPLIFYVITGRESRKCRPLLSGKSVPASIVIGFEESEFATFQADGTVHILSDEADLNTGWDVYGTEYPDRLQAREESDTVLLEFTPTWWRYTDMNTNPRTVISSEK
jgi:general stress protein 26